MFRKIFKQFTRFMRTQIKHPLNHGKEAFSDQHKYHLTEDKRIYVIGDIHGCDHLLEQKLKLIHEDIKNTPLCDHYLVTLGDYIDRGPNSRRVIELLCLETPLGCQNIHLMGNHEYYMLDFMQHPEKNVKWLDFGGRETLLSYGVHPPDLKKSSLKEAASQLKAHLPPLHEKFLKELKPYYIIDDYMFVHAGVDPDIPIKHQDPMIMMTIRAKFMQHQGAFYGKRIVHGHTPRENPEILPHRVNLDIGAYLTGKLCVAIITTNSIGFL